MNLKVIYNINKEYLSYDDELVLLFGKKLNKNYKPGTATLFKILREL